MLITLIRHGKSVDAHSGLSQHPESPLTEESKQILSVQAKSFDPRTYDAVYTSTFLRAQQTAEVLFGEGNFQVLDFVHESDMTPHLYRRPAVEAVKYWEELPAEKKENPDYRHDPRGETFQELVERTKLFMTFLRENHQESDKVVLVGHGIFIRLLLAQLMMGEHFNYRNYVQFYMGVRIANGAVVTVEYSFESKNLVMRELKNWEIM